RLPVRSVVHPVGVPVAATGPGPALVDPADAALSSRPCCSGEWRNWQTRWLQVPVSERTWGFKSPLAHQAGRLPGDRSRFAGRPAPGSGADHDGAGQLVAEAAPGPAHRG